MRKTKIKPNRAEQREINNRKRFIERDNRFGSHEGCFRYHQNNSDAHELTKLAVFLDLVRQGHTVLTEVKFNTGGRADIVDLTAGDVIEILHTESEESFQKKRAKYPSEFNVLKIRAKEYRLRK